MAYPRENTILTGGTSAAATAQTVKLPNAATGALPATQTGGTPNPIGANSRWRIKFLSITFGGAAVATPVTVTVGDGHSLFTLDLLQSIVLNDIDWQFAPGAEVDVICAAGPASAISHVNVSAVSEG